MQKLARLILLVILGLSILAAVVFLALNLYVQSKGTQDRFQQELRHRFGTDLKIGRISVTPWSGLKLSDITIAQSGSGPAGNFLEAKDFGLRIAFFSIFTRRLMIKEVSLVGPKVVWAQNADGKWRLPDLRHETRTTKIASPHEANPVPPEAPDAGSSPLPSPASSRPTVQGLRKTSAQIAFISEIHKVSVSDGTFRFLDRNNNLVANFEGVAFRAVITNGSSLKGNARVAAVSLRDRFFLQQLRSPLRYDSNGLDLSKISAHAGGGEINGQFTMQPETEESPFHVDLKFHGIQADQIIAEAGGPSGVLQGKLEGGLQAEGKTTDSDALSGTGDVFLKDGQLRQYNLLVMLGQLFQIEELTQLHLEQAEAKYHLSPGLVTIDELMLRSPNIHLSASGTVNFRGKLHLNSHLAINDKIREQLFKPIRANFQPTEEPGYSAVEFEVNGTLERPKTNLLEKVVGRDLRDLVNSFWGGGGKGEKPKKKKQQNPDLSAESPDVNASPEATPSATP